MRINQLDKNMEKMENSVFLTISLINSLRIILEK